MINDHHHRLMDDHHHRHRLMNDQSSSSSIDEWSSSFSKSEVLDTIILLMLHHSRVKNWNFAYFTHFDGNFALVNELYGMFYKFPPSLGTWFHVFSWSKFFLKMWLAKDPQCSKTAVLKIPHVRDICDFSTSLTTTREFNKNYFHINHIFENWNEAQNQNRPRLPPQKV